MPRDLGEPDLHSRAHLPMAQRTSAMHMSRVVDVVSRAMVDHSPLLCRTV